MPRRGVLTAAATPSPTPDEDEAEEAARGRGKDGTASMKRDEVATEV